MKSVFVISLFLALSAALCTASPLTPPLGSLLPGPCGKLAEKCMEAFKKSMGDFQRLEGVCQIKSRKIYKKPMCRNLCMKSKKSGSTTAFFCSRASQCYKKKLDSQASVEAKA